MLGRRLRQVRAALEKLLSAGSPQQADLAPRATPAGHRAVMFGALALGETAILGFQEGEDLLGTAAALRAMCAPGARTVQEGSVWRVRGFGVGTAREPLGMKLMNSLGTYEAT